MVCIVRTHARMRRGLKRCETHLARAVSLRPDARVPGKRSGAWVFRDTRTPVSVVFDNLEVGASISEIMDWFHLSHEQVSAVIAFAARSLDAPPALPQPTHAVDAHTL